MKLDFIIDKNYLIQHTLKYVETNRFSSEENREDILNFAGHVFQRSPYYYDILVGVFSPQNIMERSLDDFLQKLAGGLPNFLGEIKESKKFEEILSQTEKYAKTVESQWNENFRISERVIKELTGFDLNKEFDVYITHPSQKNGTNWGDNIISWGTTEKYKNYSTIYLWHEVLHSYFGDSEKEHATVELIADEELRKRLNNSNYPPFEGHKDLSDLKEKMLPYWREYVDSKNENINLFQNAVKYL